MSDLFPSGQLGYLSRCHYCKEFWDCAVNLTEQLAKVDSEDKKGLYIDCHYCKDIGYVDKNLGDDQRVVGVGGSSSRYSR